MAGEIINPKVLIIPKYTTAQRDLLKAEIGTLIHNTTDNKLNVCDVDRTVGASSWAPVTST